MKMIDVVKDYLVEVDVASFSEFLWNQLGTDLEMVIN